MKVWNIEAVTGYKPITTFWNDFTIADAFGVSAIEDTFNRAFSEWKGNYKYLTELVLVLNHKICQYHKTNGLYAEVYENLWERADVYACEHLTGDEAQYYYSVTD